MCVSVFVGGLGGGDYYQTVSKVGYILLLAKRLSIFLGPDEITTRFC